MDASLFGRGAGEGLGVHILTGPVYVRGAEEGDVIELRIIDVAYECSLNGTFQIILHKKADLAGTALEGLDYPMLGPR